MSTPTSTAIVTSLSSVLASPTPISTILLSKATQTLTISPTQINRTPITGKASFVSENYPDNTVMQPGQKFTKTFEIKNVGSKSWTTAYSLRLNMDLTPKYETFSSPPKIDFSHEVPAGNTVNISIPLIAPMTPGTYTVFWNIKDEQGNRVLVDGGDNIWIKILVCDPAQPCVRSPSSGGATVNGITASLKSFTYDDQSVTVVFCMNLPNRNYTLDPAPSLLIDQKPAPFLEGGADSTWNCTKLKYQVGATERELAQRITLLMNGSLRMSPPLGDPNVACDFARTHILAQHPGLNFQCSFSMAGYYTDLVLSPGMSREWADQLIRDTIEGAIYGPWELSIH